MCIADRNGYQSINPHNWGILNPMRGGRLLNLKIIKNNEFRRPKSWGTYNCQMWFFHNCMENWVRNPRGFDWQTWPKWIIGAIRDVKQGLRPAWTQLDFLRGQPKPEPKPGSTWLDLIPTNSNSQKGQTQTRPNPIIIWLNSYCIIPG